MSSGGVPVHPGGGDDGAPATRAHPWVDAAPGVDAWSIDRCGLDVAEDEVLGQGATGCVYRGTLGAREVAVKIMQPKQGRSAAERHQMLEDVLQEVKFGKLLPSHPNLPVFVGSCASEDGPWVVWERIHGAGLDALSSTLAASGGLPKEAQILSWSQQLYSALACLHSVGLMHRDVKPANIMLASDLKAITLIDYGLCRSFSTDTACSPESIRAMTGVTGSFRYMAPEVVAEKQYDAKVDVYSAAFVTWFMLTGGFVPFSNLPGETVAELAARVALRPCTAGFKNPPLSHLLDRAWADDPSGRPDAQEMESALGRLVAASKMKRQGYSKLKLAAAKMASVVFSASSRSVETSPESGTDRCETGSRRSEDSSPRTTSPAGSESWTGMSGMLMPRMFRRVSSRGENDSAASVASTVVDSNGSSCCPTPEPCDTETSLYTRVTSDSL